ncbi:MAG: alpha/beta hydrolase [bacterium]|nr:alpha/beta hydrolase [bacterium]MCP5067968.1 alpha/beta hydrolase [bacterium]
MADPIPADVITQLLQMNPPETVEDMRSLLDGFAGFLNTDLPEVGAFHPAVPIGAFSADVIVPKGEGPHPVLVYLHGGGWICGSPATHAKLAHRFAEAGNLVVNVDYRMAPEHPFPTPFDDCVEAVRWAAREVAAYGGDPARIAIGGDSAGGNLSAAVAAALAADPSGPALRAALLIYGVFDFATISAELPPEVAAAIPALPGGFGEQMIDLMVGSYLGQERSDGLLRDPRVSPVHAAAKLPPCHVVCGTSDPLVAQARALKTGLEAAGVPHEYFEDEGMPHGYAQMEFLPSARPAIDRMVRFLEAQFEV